MMRRRVLLVLAVIGVVAMAGLASAARADFELTLQVSNGTTQGTKVTIDVPADSGPATYSGTIGLNGATGAQVFDIFLSVGTSNSPGGMNAISNLSNVLITNETNSIYSLAIGVSAQGFDSPESPPPLTVQDTISGSVMTGTVTGTAQGFADATNTLFGKGFAGSVLGISATVGGSSFSQTGSAYGFSPNGATYSETLIENLTFSGGAAVTVTGGNVEVLTPAPSAAVLVCAGAPFLGIWSYRRARRTAPVG